MTVSVDPTKTFLGTNFPTTTWAKLPPAASAKGIAFRVTDYGVPGVGLVVISDGTYWLPLGAQVLACSSVAVSVTGTLTKTALATVTVPALLLGANGKLRISAVVDVNNSANNKTLTVEFDGNVVRSATVTTIGRIFNAVVGNRNSVSSQVVSLIGDAGITAGTVLTLAVDSSQNKNLTINCTLTNTGDTGTLQDYVVEVLP